MSTPYWKVAALVSASVLVSALTAPVAFADGTTTGSGVTAIGSPVPPAVTATQDLTYLGTLSTDITGQQDGLFSQREQKYQSSPVTTTMSWTGYCRQGGRDLTIQFPTLVDVQHIQISMEQNPSYGIYLPKDVQFQGYYNGQWYALDTQTTDSNTTGSSFTGTQVYQFSSDKGVEVSAIRVYFPVGIWVFAQGLNVTGSTMPNGVIPTPSTFTTVDGSKPTGRPGSMNNYDIQNMLLVYTGNHQKSGTWSSNDFKPMLEYLNPMGYPMAPMFDTMLFLPYGSVPNTEAGYTDYLNDLFTQGQELDALNQAVGQWNTKLNRSQYKEKVVLSIPYFPFGSNDFGTVNGQDVNFGGSADDPNAVNARTTAMKWYVDTLLSKWNSADYSNLQLVGLYWNHEQFDATNPGELQMFQAAQQLAQANNLPLLWIPFYEAVGSTTWKSLGIDAAWLQPNYIEEGSHANTGRIVDAVNVAKANSMGMEVELTGLDSSTQKLYQTFLDSLDVEGFGGSHVSHAYYDGSKLLLQAEQSSDPSVRRVYDETGDFIMTGLAPGYVIPQGN